MIRFWAAGLLSVAAACASEIQPPIRVNFNLQLDPVSSTDPDVRRIELERQRDNLVWLAGWLDTIEPSKRPRLNIQIAGDHAEFYLQDPQGLDLLARLWRDGVRLSTHVLKNQYDGEFLKWSEMRPSRLLARPEVPPGEVLTPGLQSEPNTIDEIRRVWRDNFGFTERLLAKIAGITDPQRLRKLNNNGAFPLPASGEARQALYREFGITVETGGRNELFNVLFDHDVFHPWRPGTRHELAEDLSNRESVCVPLLAVVGAVRERFGAWQDLSVQAMQRRFLHLFLERREHEGTGAQSRVWTFGFTVRLADLYPEGTRRRVSQRANVQRLVEWINADFVPEVARWATPDEVASEFYEWEKWRPGVSSFAYPGRKQDWGAYPFRLEGLAKGLMRSHWVREIDVGKGIRLHEFARPAPDAEWYNGDDNSVKVRGETSRVWVAWAGGESAVVDLEHLAGPRLTVIRGATGGRVNAGSRVKIGPEPVLIEAR